MTDQNDQNLQDAGNSEANNELITSNVLFIELSDLFDGRSFDGLAAGKFTDMWGREVEFKKSEMPEYVANTLEAIKFTTSEDGEVAGLPIDMKNHEMGNAAGWIVSAELDETGEKIKLLPRWTDAGLDLIRRKAQRFFSATINIRDKIILGGTLTNWPATRDKTGKILLKPISLSSALMSLDQDQGVKEMTDQVQDVIDVEKIKAELLAAVRLELATLSNPNPKPKEPAEDKSDDLLEMLELSGAKSEVVQAFKQTMLEQYDQMQTAAKLEAQQMIASIRHESNVVQFSERVTAGTMENPYGLPIQSKELKAFLMGLTPAQAAEGMRLFSTVWQTGRVEFAELGTNKDTESKKPLPADIVAALKTGKLTVAMLGSDTLGLGDLAQYDLSQWK